MVSQAMLSLEGPAIVWATSMDSLRETTKGRTKARVMCGVYYLQVHEELFSGNHGNVSATCRICQNSDENRMHFMLGCEATGHKRVPHLQRVAQLLDSVDVTWSKLSAEVQLQVLLDPSHESLPSTIRAIQEDIVSRLGPGVQPTSHQDPDTERKISMGLRRKEGKAEAKCITVVVSADWWSYQRTMIRNR